MKSLGKQNVTSQAFVNGVKNGDPHTSKRLVYEGKDGRFYINHLSSKKEITRLSDGTYYAEWRVAALKAMTADEMIASVAAKGGPVTLVSLLGKS